MKTSVIGAFVYRQGKLRYYSIKHSRTDSCVETCRFSDVSATPWIWRRRQSLQLRGNFHTSKRLSARKRFMEFYCRERFKAHTFLFTEKFKELVSKLQPTRCNVSWFIYLFL